MAGNVHPVQLLLCQKGCEIFYRTTIIAKHLPVHGIDGFRYQLPHQPESHVVADPVNGEEQGIGVSGKILKHRPVEQSISGVA